MINNAIIISDLHAGCQFGLCPPEVQLDSGSLIKHNKYQRKVWNWWIEFWRVWVPKVTRGEPYCVVVNGDAMDGRHHNSVTQISQNLADQKKIAKSILDPIVEMCNGEFYMVRGTEVHVGRSGENEETLAEQLGAIPDEVGNYSRFELWLKVGSCLAHIMHHIGTTGSTAYETTALMKEFAESCTEAAKWGFEAPNVVVRSHRHRHSEVKVPAKDVYGICFTTAGWQLKTPFVYKIPGGRITTPQFGGSLIRQGDEEFYTRHFTRTLPRTKPEIAGG